eukprot:GHVU01167276.1.p1 GENE.GHVU01167276.1~~GHVU01167276.1.p1  ORF type:complete len:141 (+),score=5.56 GHVU01167276.1:234-656(+)
MNGTRSLFILTSHSISEWFSMSHNANCSSASHSVVSSVDLWLSLSPVARLGSGRHWCEKDCGDETPGISQDDAGGGIIMAAHVHRNVGPMFGFHFCPFEGVRVSACALVTHRGVVGGCGSTLVDGGRWKGAGPSMIAVVS